MINIVSNVFIKSNNINNIDYDYIKDQYDKQINLSDTIILYLNNNENIYYNINLIHLDNNDNNNDKIINQKKHFSDKNKYKFKFFKNIKQSTWINNLMNKLQLIINNINQVCNINAFFDNNEFIEHIVKFGLTVNPNKYLFFRNDIKNIIQFKNVFDDKLLSIDIINELIQNNNYDLQLLINDFYIKDNIIRPYIILDKIIIKTMFLPNDILSHKLYIELNRDLFNNIKQYRQINTLYKRKMIKKDDICRNIINHKY